ncbi:hypothetical protein SAMN05444358_1011514 [Ruegeria halocynthiae]|uniref:DUF6455 domain-containing protein n=1 Tax=Ruegeria halocynthiae TaxID=985054 RepID=A0A1H2VLF1_9RHOB|nr:DUF6455 family protein [Ruegeria halocynthiae]SDW69080.1 hypothetical protein SAMN05444358_1011514 [Ruegeria halocynthiae]
MSDRKTLRRHADLLDRMATTLGVDLQEVAIGGTLRFDEISDAVLRCTECPNPGHCETYLAQNSATPKAPEYCRNHELLSRLLS